MLLDSMPHTTTAKRRTRARDAMGGYRDTFATVFSDRECWRQAAGDNEITWWQQRNVDITHRVFFATDPGLEPDDILISGGYEWEVKSSADPDDSAGMGVLWRVMVQRGNRTM